MRTLADLASASIDRGLVADPAWVTELRQMPAHESVGLSGVKRSELAFVYARRSRRMPGNAALEAVALKLAGYDGETVMLGYFETPSFAGHLFLDETASTLLGVVMKSRRTIKSTGLEELNGDA